MANSVSNLRNKFATQALRTLENVVLRSLPDVEGFDRHDIYKEWVNWSLTGSVHDQVFYYQTYEELDDENDAAVAEPAKKVYRGVSVDYYFGELIYSFHLLPGTIPVNSHLINTRCLL